ncbi:hypothetical protein F0562_018881 [Nyssa sinensis]|uniref:Uncharacterized protein n=1 Tax=Nyssa sinensis TaxID=561372 RepID=A0A5J4ZD58_9ASTE|nr:hypothetical protein F0562_018881 [Nyssa sinensis]
MQQQPYKNNNTILQSALYKRSLGSVKAVTSLEMEKPQSLVNLCLGVLAQHFEDIFEDLHNIAANLSFPPEIKMALAAIARRKKLLNDDFLVLLAGSSWEILDVSGSDVSDFGLEKVAKICKSLRAVDISRCSKITRCGVSELVSHCRSLEILRCGFPLREVV